MILVSACLIGINCRYDGKSQYNEKVLQLVKEGKAIPICPEQLGGLATPRNPAEIIKKDNKVCIIDNQNTDMTDAFMKGANEVLKLAKELDINKAILKSKSPSCGVGKVYSGNFDGKIVDGNGVLAQLLMDNGIEVINADEF